MNKDEALKLALQLVSNLRTHSWTVADEQLVITAIKEALAQPEQDYNRGYADAMNWKVQNHLEHLPSKEPETWEKFCDSNCVWTDHHPDCKLAQRKPLTDEEIQDLLMPVRISGDGYYLRIARAIEAAHGIKEEA